MQNQIFAQNRMKISNFESLKKEENKGKQRGGNEELQF